VPRKEAFLMFRLRYYDRKGVAISRARWNELIRRREGERVQAYSFIARDEVKGFPTAHVETSWVGVEADGVEPPLIFVTVLSWSYGEGELAIPSKRPDECHWTATRPEAILMHKMVLEKLGGIRS
jgi:hypothetical protein